MKRRNFTSKKAALAQRLELSEPVQHPRNPKWKVQLPPEIELIGYLEPELGLEVPFQNKAAKYLDEQNLLFHHSPSEGKRGKGKQLTHAGMKKGFPDLFIYETNSQYAGLAIELKVRGGDPSSEQIEWLVKLSGRGYKSILCFSFDSFCKAVRKYKSDIIPF